MSDWPAEWFDHRIEPPGRVLVDEILAYWAKGILFRSSMLQGGTNIVPYIGYFSESDSLDVHDPSGAMPRNQDSWLWRVVDK